MTLFGSKNIGDLFNEQREHLKNQIQNEFNLQMDKEEYIAYLISVYELEELVTDKEKVRREEIEIEKGNLPWIKFTILIPYQGPDSYFSYKPSSYIILDDLNFYKKTPNQKIIYFDLEFSLDNQRINYFLERKINHVLENFQNFNLDIQAYNKSLRSSIERLIDRRIENLLKFRAVSESITVPIKRRKDSPPEIPLKRKRIRLTKPESKQEISPPYSILAKNDYEEILEVCSHMGIAMERSPKTFDTLSEEQIRDFFLVILNAFFEGEATGETFNRGGKADILIRHQYANVLIVECKIWEGKSIIKKAINQLFDYITWRDTKTAVFIFYKRKRKSLTNVMEEIKSEVSNHEYFKKVFDFSNKKLKDEKTLGYIFTYPSDTKRDIYLTIMVFDIH